MLTIGIEYLTGYAVATDVTDRDRPEWPPHPARVFMAMAAAYFECGEAPEEREALLWLERQTAPAIFAGEASPREAGTHYVPVNDTLNDARAALPMLRKRQPRTFPRVWLPEPVVFLHWPDVAVSAELLAAMNRLCGKVARIGHSSSLVQMWASDGAPTASQLHKQWQPAGEENEEAAEEGAMRITGPGALEELRQRFRAQERDEYLALRERYEASTGKEAKRLKQELEERFDSICPEPVRPVFSVRSPYHPSKPTPPVAHSVWDDRLILFHLDPSKEACMQRLDVCATLFICDVFRKALIKTYGTQVPEYVSGHQPDGAPTMQPHCAFFTLPFVDEEKVYADGHLMGIAIAYPAAIREAERRDLVRHAGEIRHLTLGKLGKWQVQSGIDMASRHTLRCNTWCGEQAGQTEWATVTPVVFDEHPKTKERAGYLAEVAKMIAQGCRRIGLPEPVCIETSHVSIFYGAPTSQEYPRMQRKDGSQRRHLHAKIVFEQPVRGPLIIGAGRYRGYGLLRPFRRKCNEES